MDEEKKGPETSTIDFIFCKTFFALSIKRSILQTHFFVSIGCQFRSLYLLIKKSNYNRQVIFMPAYFLQTSFYRGPPFSCNSIRQAIVFLCDFHRVSRSIRKQHFFTHLVNLHIPEIFFYTQKAHYFFGSCNFQWEKISI